jgi:hypothetical protein
MLGLLDINCFNIFQELFKSFEGIIDLTTFLPIKKLLSDIVEWMIDPLFEEVFKPNLFKSR